MVTRFQRTFVCIFISADFFEPLNCTVEVIVCQERFCVSICLRLQQLLLFLLEFLLFRLGLCFQIRRIFEISKLCIHGNCRIIVASSLQFRSFRIVYRGEDNLCYDNDDSDCSRNNSTNDNSDFSSFCFFCCFFLLKLFLLHAASLFFSISFLFLSERFFVPDR